MVYKFLALSPDLQSWCWSWTNSFKIGRKKKYIKGTVYVVLSDPLFLTYLNQNFVRSRLKKTRSTKIILNYKTGNIFYLKKYIFKHFYIVSP